MKKMNYFLFAFLAVFSMQMSLGQVTVNGSGSYGTIQAGVNAATPGQTVQFIGTSFAENVVINKAITLQGTGAANSVLTHTGGIGISVSVAGVTLKDFKVTGTVGHGIYVGNSVAGVTITNVTADANGNSGIALQGVTGTSVLTNITATNNTTHGLSIGNGCVGVKVNGGTFTGNGTNATTSTGGGIAIYADAGKKADSTVIVGTINASNNKIAGIYITAAVGATSLTGTRIGMDLDGTNNGTVTLNNNWSTNGTDSGGAAVIVYGPAAHTWIRANSTRSGGAKTAGIVVVGTDGSGSNSPMFTVVKDCNIFGFNSSNPAGTMSIKLGTDSLKGTTDVDATSGNSIDGNALAGFAVEDQLNHKLDNASLGLFHGPGTVVYVTANSGSIQRGIDIAALYTVTQVNVQDGTYAENVVVNHALTVAGQGANTKVQPSSGAAMNVTVTGVTVQDMHFYRPFTASAAVTATNNTFTYPVLAKVFLEGPFSAGTMSTTLATGSYLPTSQPYSTLGYNGTEAVAGNSVFTSNNVTDWVLIELRSTSNGTAVAKAAGLLKNDGSILNETGTVGVSPSVTKSGLDDYLYYVVVKHRNHLSIMSANSVQLPNATTYDFTSGQSQAFGTTPMFALAGGVFGMRAGDVNSSALVTSADANLINAKINQTGYFYEDTNLSALITSSDVNLVNSELNNASQLP